MTLGRKESMAANYRVPAVIRTIDILEFLSRQKEASFTEIHTNLRIPKSTAYHIPETLISRGYLRFEGNP